MPDHHRPFGGDRFGILAERFARFFGTPKFIISQTVIIMIWLAVNAVVVALRWDPYPFILLNLVFSTQAAYAAPLILLAQTRQADRDHIRDEAAHEHSERQAERDRRFEESQEAMLAQDEQRTEQHARMLEQNTALTREVARLTKDLHAALIKAPNGSAAEKPEPQPASSTPAP
jgi:uncharacterized membrane protein